MLYGIGQYAKQSKYASSASLVIVMGISIFMIGIYLVYEYGDFGIPEIFFMLFGVIFTAFGIAHYIRNKRTGINL